MATKNKVFVITGASRSGIGQAITRKVLETGSTVYGSYERDQREVAEAISSEYEKLYMTEVDHSSRASLRDFVSHLPEEGIDAFVNAEMYFEMEDPENFDHDVWDKSIAVNLTAPNFIIHELKHRMVKGASATIITSTEGFIGSFGASAYAATKAAVHNLVKTHANNLGSRGVRVNALAPGWIGGVMDTDEVFNMSRQITPLGRLGTPEEVANCVVFLASDQASFVNGAVLIADGGYSGVDTIAKYEFDQSKT